jgi:hypothetical protein
MVFSHPSTQCGYSVGTSGHHGLSGERHQTGSITTQKPTLVISMWTHRILHSPRTEGKMSVAEWLRRQMARSDGRGFKSGFNSGHYHFFFCFVLTTSSFEVSCVPQCDHFFLCRLVLLWRTSSLSSSEQHGSWGGVSPGVIFEYAHCQQPVQGVDMAVPL